MAFKHARYINVAVNDCKAKFKIDSGAEVTVVSPSFSGTPYKPDENGGQLSDLDNQSLPALGKFEATNSRKGKSLRQLLYVMESQTTPPLCLSAIEVFEVVCFLDAVGHVSDGIVTLPNARIFQGFGTLPSNVQLKWKAFIDTKIRMANAPQS